MSGARHIEFFDRHHFEQCYYRMRTKGSLSAFIDFFWETKFEDLWHAHPAGFLDMLFPDLGYTYMINLGTPFNMLLNEQLSRISSDSFIPRTKNITCFHTEGNRVFGIKFKVSPVVFQKHVDFGEYKSHVFPLAYLIDRPVIELVKRAHSFNERIEILSSYYKELIRQNTGKMKKVTVVTSILKTCNDTNNFNISIEELASDHSISPRTLQRYFETTVGTKCKPALQLMRIRKAIYHWIDHPDTFHFSAYGYYDLSHFLRHARAFFQNHPRADIKFSREIITHLRSHSPFQKV